jgi:ubiquinone biosynthesis protein COQ9
MRDLKADLEELKSLKENDVHFMSIVCFIENNAEKWLEQGVVELERAIKAEKQLEDLLAWEEPKEKCYLSAMRRIARLESLVRELVEALEHIERLTELVWQGVGPVTAEIRLAVEGALEKAKKMLRKED